jgi:hypothetical protein
MTTSGPRAVCWQRLNPHNFDLSTPLNHVVLPSSMIRPSTGIVSREREGVLSGSAAIKDVTVDERGGLRLIDYLRWAELHIYLAVHELSLTCTRRSGQGPNRYNGAVWDVSDIH